MIDLQRLPLIIVLSTVLACGGCATVKRWMPWASDGDESVEAATTTAAGSMTAADDKAAGTAIDGSPAGDGSATSGKVGSADRKAADGTLDLSVPATAAPPPGARSTSAAVAGSAVASPPAASALPARVPSTDDTQAGSWAALLHEAIQRNWLRPSGPQIPVDFSCEVLVKLTRSGIVEDAQVTRSCGHPSLDASVISAVQAASPLPLPADMGEFIDTLLLNFSP